MGRVEKRILTGLPSVHWSWIAVVALAMCLPSAALPAVESTPVQCRIRFMPPSLDFEFRFFTGFTAGIPVRELIGDARVTGIRLTVTPLSIEAAKPMVLDHTLEIGPIPDHFKGEAQLRGSFVVGEGRYHVRWDLQDALGHFCSVEWEVEAKLAKSQKDLAVSMRPGEMGDSRVYLFRPEASVIDPTTRPLDIKVFLNFDVWRRRESAVRVRLWEYSRRIATLRALARNPRIGKISLIVYSLEEQEVFYRHGLQDSIDFAPMEEAIEKLSPAFVAFEQLGQHKERDFFGEVLLAETRNEDVDALVFIGPDFQFGKRLSKDDEMLLRRTPAPAFYFKTNGGPWKGLVGRAIKAMRGQEIAIYSPGRLAKAVERVVEGLDAGKYAN